MGACALCALCAAPAPFPCTGLPAGSSARPPRADATASVAPAPGGGWRITVTAALLVPPAGDAGDLTAEIASLGVTAQRPVALPPPRAGAPPEGEARLVLEVPPAAGARLWWPIGLGAQPLYDLAVGFEPSGGGCGGGDAAGGGGGACSRLARRVGFRRVELVTDPLPAAARGLAPQRAADGANSSAAGTEAAEGGTVFYLRVNGVPVYAKARACARACAPRAGLLRQRRPCNQARPPVWAVAARNGAKRALPPPLPLARAPTSSPRASCPPT